MKQFTLERVEALSRLHADGVLSMREVCMLTGVPHSTVQGRVSRGKSLVEAIMHGAMDKPGPIKKLPAMYEWQGKVGSVSWWASQLGMSVGGMKSRLEKYGPTDPRTYEKKRERPEFEGLSDKDRSYVLDSIPSASWEG